MTIEQAARNFFSWFNKHYPAPSNHPDHEWNRLGSKLAELQEPVAWMVYTLDGKSVCVTDNPAEFTEQHWVLPLFTEPQPSRRR